MSPALRNMTTAGETQNPPAAAPIGVLSAVRRHWIVATLPVILLVGAAVALGIERPPRYTATANLSVGRIYVNNPAGVSGVLEATQSLAAVYSRAIRSTAVQTETARRFGRDSLPASNQVSATPVPDSPLIKVSAEASSERRAVALANTASRALARYVKRQGQSDQDAAILARYQQAVRLYRTRLAEARELTLEYEVDPTPENEAARDQAKAAVSVALLRREALRASYLNMVQGTTSTPAVEVFSRATSATSDQVRMMQTMVFLGLVAGVATGISLALLRSYRKTRPRTDG